jgi:hypothetical protein
VISGLISASPGVDFNDIHAYVKKRLFMAILNELIDLEERDRYQLRIVGNESTTQSAIGRNHESKSVAP